MGMSPRMYVSASFYVGIITDEEKDVLNDELDAAGFLVVHEDESGVDGNYTDGYVTVLTFLTSSWGDSLGIDDLKEEYDIFVSNITEFCVSRKKCKLPSFRLGAAYW